MTFNNAWIRRPSLWAFTLVFVGGFAITTRFLVAQSPVTPHQSFDQIAKPFLNQNCLRCHNGDTTMAGVRVDQLDGALEDRHIRLWEAMRERIESGTMPPKGASQPTANEKHAMVQWINEALETARSRPAPKNGLIRRLTVAQYRNTLRELLMLDDDVTEALPPDAVSKDGFQNNTETLQLSPLLTEAYFEIAEEALRRSIVDPNVKPSIQNFRLDFGKSINPAPLKERLVLGAGSALLENADFTVNQLTAKKTFAFEPFFMRTKYRFIEGYQGNDTVRGWREFDSIYHSVFADMRGSSGYPKGKPHDVVGQGLLLRPAIPNDEIFGADGTYGPKANFKISLRELPDDGRFRITVTAAKYNDGLLLDTGAALQPIGPESLVSSASDIPVNVKRAGVYQVDVYPGSPPPPDASRLSEGLTGSFAFNESDSNIKLSGDAKLVESPFGKAVSLTGDTDAVTVALQSPRTASESDLTISAWIQPRQFRNASIASVTGVGVASGWRFETDARGGLRLETLGPDGVSSGSVSTRPGVLRPATWQHVAVVAGHASKEALLYVNGYLVGRGPISLPNAAATRGTFVLGSVPQTQSFWGEFDEVRLYQRQLAEAEVQALVQPGKQFAQAPPERRGPGGDRRAEPRGPDVLLSLGDRQFSGTLQQPAFVAVRLEPGPLKISAMTNGLRDAEKVVLTPLPPNHEVAREFLAFEKRLPRLGVHLGFRRDCGSTFAPVGPPQSVNGDKLTRFVFEGAMRNFPIPTVEKDNVNYLAGVREIAVRSEYTDDRDMPRLLIRSVEFEGPYYDSWPPPPHRKIFPEISGKSVGPAYAKKVIHDFATRAYRRPISAAEESALFAVYQKASASGRSFEESVRDALLVALTSPQFLFLVENSSTPAPEPVEEYELASKLSYFLWNAPPDRQTLQLAATGALRKQLDSETARMIADRRFSNFVDQFAAQWLSLEKFQVLEPDRKRYPKLTHSTRAQLKQEPIEFLKHLVRNNLPVSNLIHSDFIVGNEVVASYYDLGNKTESGFDFVAIPHKRPELGGVLTQAAILAGLSDGRESNPVKRGAWLARKIIAEPPADPPPNVPALKEEGENLTLRQRLEQHRDVPACKQCHLKIDPWGVALEEFDAGGRLKAQPVDARSTLPDKTEVAGANALKQYLAVDRIDQVAYSFLKHLTTYATGRSLTYSEANRLKRDALKLKADGYRMRDMFRYVVNSPPFLEK